MECILSRLRWQRLSGNERRGERKRRIRNVQERERFECGEASLGDLRIARSCLSQHHLGGEELVAWPLVVPPRRGEVLMGGHKQITARSCREITDDGRFDINGGLCAACIFGTPPSGARRCTHWPCCRPPVARMPHCVYGAPCYGIGRRCLPTGPRLSCLGRRPSHRCTCRCARGFTDLTGVTVQALLAAILHGERAPLTLAQ
jgi:hypothetical protein